MANVPLVSNPILPPVPDEPKLGDMDQVALQKTFDALWKWMKDVSVQLKILFGSPQSSNSSLSIALVQAGSIFPYGGDSTNVPSGYLPCDGSIVDQTQYASLYAAIGVRWNTGAEGAGNFRLPDFRGRTLVGAGTGAGLSPRTVAQLGGEENHTLSLPEVPVHVHQVTVVDLAHTHPISADGAHTHNSGAIAGGGPFLTGGGGTPGTTTQTPGNHSHSGATGATGATSLATTNSQGGGGSHNNMQPFGVVQWIIKF